MPVDQSQIQVGSYLYTPRSVSQLRRVTNMPIDPDGQIRVEYAYKYWKLLGSAFENARWKDHPPLLSDFAEECAHILDAGEIAYLRFNNIILREEYESPCKPEVRVGDADAASKELALLLSFTSQPSQIPPDHCDQ